MHTCRNQIIALSLFVFLCLPVLFCSAAPSVTFVAGTSTGWDFHELAGDGVLLQTIYGTAKDSAGNITANAVRALTQNKGEAMAFTVSQNTALDKGWFKLTGVKTGCTLRVRLFNVTGKGYLTYNHTGITKADPGGAGNTALLDISQPTGSSVPSHIEGSLTVTDLIVDFGPLPVTAGDYFMTFDAVSGSNTLGSMVRGLTTDITNMTTHPDGTPLPKHATVSTSSSITGNTYHYELSATSDINYTPRSYLTALQITTTIINSPPVVNAGTDQTITYPNNITNLSGTASDDGLPDPPGQVTVTWTMTSGPGTVTFGNIHLVDTTASFSVDGTYVLRLTASDSNLSSYDEVTITVEPAINEDPLINPTPPSTLLPPNATEFTFSLQSSVPTQCRYSLGTAAAFSTMTPFDSGDGTTSHQTIIHGLDPNPNNLNELYVRCAAYPDFVLHQRYRCLAQANPSYPRTGNLWGDSWAFVGKSMPYCAKIDLWLGASFTADQIRQLRLLNPDIIILTSINAVENYNLPDDYYLKDIYGNRAEVWPGDYRLNLTKPYVAEYQARFAYQSILDNDLMFDGCFFDNVYTTISWFNQDIYGNNFIIDADEDGIADDPVVLDAAWKAGVFHELSVFRTLMPGAITSGHAMNIYEPGISDIFNGISLNFETANVIEGVTNFDQLWNLYKDWNTLSLPPHVTMFESSPQLQISYGYGYNPLYDIPPETLEFARTYYPFVRFGLALTLMNDGYFAHEFGDTLHGNDWWYDELDFNLGYPLGPAKAIEVGGPPPQNQLLNGSFEQSLNSSWSLWANSGCVANVTRDLTQHTDGAASAKITVTQTTGTDEYIEFEQYNCSLTKDTPYTLTFWAKADKSRAITLITQKGSPDWDDYGLYQQIPITTDWQEYSASFIAKADTTESRVQFCVGHTTGTVWLDNISLQRTAPKIISRKFTNGLVLLNASDQPQTIDLGLGYRRLTGSQAPLYEYIIDDSAAAFSTTGTWTTTTYDSGLWKDAGPFYHNWGSTCRQSNSPTSQTRWNLTIPASDTYSIYIWWPAAPTASSWCKNVTCQVVAAGNVVASNVLDQSTAGDRWHFVAQVHLAPSDAAYVRLTGSGTGLCIADALDICSAARYNNGSPAPTVTLQPMDGIVLDWTAVDGDINSDGIVNMKDFALLATCWLQPPSTSGLDIAPATPDNIINYLDLQQLASHWLTGP